MNDQLGGRQGPAIGATVYVRGFEDQTRAFVPMTYAVLAPMTVRTPPTGAASSK